MKRNGVALLLTAVFCASPAAAGEATFSHLAMAAQERDARLAAEEHNVQVRVENVRIRQASFYPQLRFSSSISETKRHVGRSEASTGVVEHSLDASMNLFNRRQGYDRLSAQSELHAQLHRRDDVSQEVRLDVVTALLETHAAHEEWLLLKKRLDGMKQRLELARAREEQGVAPKLEIVLAEAEMETVKGDLAVGDARLQKARQALFNLTGVAVAELPRLGEGFRPMPLPPVEKVLEKVVQGNLELKNALQNLQAHRHRESAANADHYPSLALTSEYNEFSSGDSNSSIALVMSIPIYSGGALLSGDRVAAEQRLAFAENIRDYRRRLRQSVFELHRDAEALIRQENALRAQLEARADLLEKTRLAWLEGLRTAQDVIDAEQSLFENERDLRSLYFQHLRIGAQLQRLSGDLSFDYLARLDGYFR